MGEELRIQRSEFLTRLRGRGTTKWWRGRCRAYSLSRQVSDTSGLPKSSWTQVFSSSKPVAA